MMLTVTRVLYSSHVGQKMNANIWLFCATLSCLFPLYFT